MLKRTFFYGIWLMLALLFVAQCSRNNLEMVETPRPAEMPRVTETSASEPQALAPQMTDAPAPSEPVIAPASNAPVDAPPDVIRRAMMAQLQAPRERSITKMTDADGTVTEMYYAFIAPGSIHVRTDDMEIIAIQGQGAWQKKGDGWEPAPETLAQPYLTARDPEAVEPLLAMIVWRDAAFVGAEMLNGKPMWRYTYTTLVKGLGANGGDLRGENQLWVGVSDGLPYKLLSTSDSVLETGKKDTIEQTHEYDAAFVIEPPR